MQFQYGQKAIPRHHTKKFRSRVVKDIIGCVVHQTAGSGDAIATAEYHISRDCHVSEGGCPGLLYTFFIEASGTIWQAHDLDRRVWSQGGHGSPVPNSSANGNFLSICIGGNFEGSGYDADEAGPTFQQIHALVSLWAHLTGEMECSVIPARLFRSLSCPVEAMYGHHLFGKAACPGFVLGELVDSVRGHMEAASEDEPWTTEDWQTGLKSLGYYSGGIDGDWGPKSRGALVKLQRNTALIVDGERGPLSQAMIETKLKAAAAG